MTLLISDGWKKFTKMEKPPQNSRRQKRHTKQVPCPGPTHNRRRRKKFSCPRFVHPWMPNVKKAFGNKVYIKCSPLLSPCTTIIIYNSKSAMNPPSTMLRMSGINAYRRVSVVFDALVSAEYVPDVVCYWRRRLIATSLPILLRVSLFLWLSCWCWKWRSQGMSAVKY